MSIRVVNTGGSTIKVNVGVQPAIKIEAPEVKVLNINAGVPGPVGPQGPAGDGSAPSGSVLHQIEDPIDVTNPYKEIGNALNKFYVSGTDIETILRDILTADTVPTIPYYKPVISLNGGGNSDLSGDVTYEWGASVSLNGHKFSLTDPSENFDESKPIKIVAPVYGSAYEFMVSHFGQTDWHDVSFIAELTQPDVPEKDLAYHNLYGYTKSYSTKMTLEYIKSTGGTGTASTETVDIKFAKKRWLVSSSINLKDGDTIANLNEFLSSPSTTIMDDDFTVGTTFSFTTDYTSGLEDRSTYILIPQELNIDTTVGSSITQGVFNYGTAFINQGVFTYDTGYDKNGEDVLYGVRIYQSNQEQAFPGGSDINVTAY